MTNFRFVSADSHMMEPADLWTTRLDKNFRERSPKVIQNPKKPGLIFVAEGIDPFPVAGGFGAGRSGEELKEHLSKGYEAARPSGWDPVERIKDQELDGVEAEVLYTTGWIYRDGRWQYVHWQGTMTGMMLEPLAGKVMIEPPPVN